MLLPPSARRLPEAPAGRALGGLSNSHLPLDGFPCGLKKKRKGKVEKKGGGGGISEARWPLLCKAQEEDGGWELGRKKKSVSM